MITVETIVAAALRHPVVLTTLGPALRDDLVTPNPYYRQLMDFAVTFHREHRTAPQSGDLELWMGGLPPVQKDGVRESLQRLQTVDLRVYTPEYLARETIAELQSTAARTAVARMSAAGSAVTPETVQSLNQRLQNIRPVGLTEIASLREVEKYIFPDPTDRIIPSCVDRLNYYIGGYQKELTLILADSGIGKTTFLINEGQNAMLLGNRVLHITFELSRQRTLNRYYRRITESDQPTIRNEVELVINRTRHWLRFAKGEVHVLYHRPYAMTPDELRTIVDQYAQEFGGVDMVILDYLDLMAPPTDARHLKPYDQLGRLTHEVRALTIEFNCDVMSATQAVRRANGASRLTLADMGDSYNKVRGAGVILGLVQSEDEVVVHQGRLCILKVRDNPGRGAEIPVYVNLDLMMIADLDHANTRAVMQRFNHLPSPAMAAAA